MRKYIKDFLYQLCEDVKIPLISVFSGLMIALILQYISRIYIEGAIGTISYIGSIAVYAITTIYGVFSLAVIYFFKIKKGILEGKQKQMEFKIVNEKKTKLLNNLDLNALPGNSGLAFKDIAEAIDEFKPFSKEEK